MTMTKEEIEKQIDLYVNREIYHNLCLTADKELKENPDLLFEAKNYYAKNENGDKDENGEYPEIMEFWAVSDWMANKLEEKGEVVFEMLDFNVWGRQCTGQRIKMDYIMEEIAKDTDF